MSRLSTVLSDMKLVRPKVPGDVWLFGSYLEMPFCQVICCNDGRLLITILG